MTTITIPDHFEEFPPLPVFLQQNDIAFLSGGIGSQLAVRNLPAKTDGLPTIASVVAPELLTEIHSEYAQAGASILTVDTFDLSPWRQQKHLGDNEKALALASQGITAAYEAARKAQDRFPDRPLYLAGSLTSLNDCYTPDATPDKTTLLTQHFRQVALHAQNNADLLCLETIPTVREAVAMIKASEAHKLPFIVSFTVGDNGNPLDGSSLEEAEKATRSPYRIGIGVNCCQIEAAQRGVEKLASIFARNADHKTHIVAYPNGYAHTREEFHAQHGSGIEKKHTHTCERKKQVLAANDFACIAADLRDKGATIIGGCCGTSPAHTQAYVNALGGRLQRRLVA